MRHFRHATFCSYLKQYFNCKLKDASNYRHRIWKEVFSGRESEINVSVICRNSELTTVIRIILEFLLFQSLNLFVCFWP